MDFMMRQVNHECATRGVAGFRVAYRLDGSLIRAPDNEESELSALLLMYADDLGTGWCVSVSQPPAEVCLTDLAWDYPGV